MMKTVLTYLAILGLVIIGTGCSGTWDGVKEDSGNMWDSTKEAVHDATE